jgi:long-chain acyl-CoA synthetase
VAIDSLTLHAETIGDQLAVVDDRPGGTVRTASYYEFNATVNALANGLLDLGVTPGDRVGWWGRNSLETLAATHGIRKAAGTSVPIPYSSTFDEASYLFAHAGISALLVEARDAEIAARLTDRHPELREVVVFAGDPAIDTQRRWDDIQGSPTTPPTETAGHDTRTIIYTSGTTGRPKGAVRRVGLEANMYSQLVHLLGWDSAKDFTFLLTGPLYHSGPSGFTHRAQLVGGTVVLQYQFDAEDWLRLVDAYKVTATFTAPTPIRRVIALPEDVRGRYDVSSMCCTVANAAPWTMSLKEAYLDNFPSDSLWEVYGSTELSVCTALAPEDQLRKPGSCGIPAPGVELRLLDAERRVITEPQVEGELFARSASLFETYHNAHDRYVEDHADGFQTVGDVAYRDEDGYFYIRDRKKDMIITGGVNVYPAEIENVLESHPMVYEAAVLGIADEDWGEAVCAVVVLAEPVEPDALTAYVRERVSGPKTPKRILVVDELPKTGTGKVLKRDLPPLFA